MTMLTDLPQFGDLLEQRLSILHELASSLEASQLPLSQNDAQAIARGAAHQAELCRQWAKLESDLRRQSKPERQKESCSDENSAGRRSAAELQMEWEALHSRITHLARVHGSLLRHLERSMALLRHVVEGCEPTYRPDPKLLRPDFRPHTGE